MRGYGPEGAGVVSRVTILRKRIAAARRQKLRAECALIAAKRELQRELRK